MVYTKLDDNEEIEMRSVEESSFMVEVEEDETEFPGDHEVYSSLTQPLTDHVSGSYFRRNAVCLGIAVVFVVSIIIIGLGLGIGLGVRHHQSLPQENASPTHGSNSTEHTPPTPETSVSSSTSRRSTTASTTKHTPSTTSRPLSTKSSTTTASTTKQSPSTTPTPLTSKSSTTTASTTKQTRSESTTSEVITTSTKPSDLTTTTTTPLDINSVNDCKIESFDQYAKPTAGDEFCKVVFNSGRDAFSTVKLKRISHYIVAAPLQVRFLHGTSEIDLITEEDMELIIPKETEITMVIPQTVRYNMFAKVVFHHEEDVHCDTVTSECEEGQWPSNRTMIQSCNMINIKMDDWKCTASLPIDVGRYHLDRIEDDSFRQAKWNAVLVTPIMADGNIYNVDHLDQHDLDVKVEKENSTLKIWESTWEIEISVRLLKFE